jgi:hypothetical protein
LICSPYNATKNRLRNKGLNDLWKIKLRKLNNSEEKGGGRLGGRESGGRRGGKRGGRRGGRREGGGEGGGDEKEDEDETDDIMQP